MPVRARAVVTLFAFTLVATACGGQTVTTTEAAGPTSEPPASGRPDPAPTSAAPVEVPEVLEFEAPLLSGGTLRGADYAGKDVAFWFWAPW